MGSAWQPLCAFLRLSNAANIAAAQPALPQACSLPGDTGHLPLRHPPSAAAPASSAKASGAPRALEAGRVLAGEASALSCDRAVISSPPSRAAGGRDDTQPYLPIPAAQPHVRHTLKFSLPFEGSGNRQLPELSSELREEQNASAILWAPSIHRAIRLFTHPSTHP